MDKSAISYFEQKFGTHDAEELGDLVARRHDLSDEAVEALERVLAAKGLNASDVFSAPLLVPQVECKDVADQTKNARDLWRGGLSVTCKFFAALIFIVPVQVLLKSFTVGAIWAGLMVLAAGYVGYRVGHAVTRNICANANVSAVVKKKNLWIMFALLWPIYFLVYGLTHAVLSRG